MQDFVFLSHVPFAFLQAAFVFGASAALAITGAATDIRRPAITAALKILEIIKSLLRISAGHCGRSAKAEYGRFFAGFWRPEYICVRLQRALIKFAETE